MKKYSLEKYTDIEAPLFIFGCYAPQLQFHNPAVLNPLSRKVGTFTVICWAGTDAKDLTRGNGVYYSYFIEIFKQRPDIKHIAMSKWIADDLESLGIPCYRLPVFVHDIEDYSSCPLGDSIYMYRSDKHIYNGNGLYQKIKERVPYNFIETSATTFDRKELLEAYRKCFIGLRFTEHDGMNHTGCELGLMGRRQIYNGGLPNSITFDKGNIDGIIEAINKEYSRLNDWLYVGNEMREYLDRGDAFLHTGFYT